MFLMPYWLKNAIKNKENKPENKPFYVLLQYVQTEWKDILRLSDNICIPPWSWTQAFIQHSIALHMLGCLIPEEERDR